MSSGETRPRATRGTTRVSSRDKSGRTVLSIYDLKLRIFRLNPFPGFPPSPPRRELINRRIKLFFPPLAPLPRVQTRDREEKR